MLAPKEIKLPRPPDCRKATHHAVIVLSVQGGKISSPLPICLIRSAWVDLKNNDKIPHHLSIDPPDMLGLASIVVLPNQTFRLQAKQYPVSRPEFGRIIDMTLRPPLEYPIVLCPSYDGPLP